MKTLIILCSFAFASLARAADFKLTNAEVRDLVVALQALDGFEREVDRGPGNGRAVIRVNYSFTHDVRAKLAANLTVLTPIARSVQERLDAKRIETVLALGVQRIDPTNEIHVYQLNLRIKPILSDVVSVELAAVTVDDLKVGKEEGENPIPISVGAVLNLLRTPAAK
jgi:hypothetical protein